jgi:type IV pilus assembly protein PilF
MSMRLPAVLAALCLVASPQVRAVSGSSKNAAELNVQLGIQYLRQGNLQVAREKIERALKQDPNNISVQLAVALLAEQLADPNKAEKHYRQALRIDGTSPEAANAYASYLCRRGNAREGEAMFERAAKNPLYRTPEIAYTNAGTCAHANGRLAEAEAYLRQALAIRAMSPDALMQMTRVAATRGNWMQVRAFLQRYLAVGPPSAGLLLLGVTAERALGNGPAAAEYIGRLRRDFADSPETRSLDEPEERNPG